MSVQLLIIVALLQSTYQSKLWYTYSCTTLYHPVILSNYTLSLWLMPVIIIIKNALIRVTYCRDAEGRLTQRHTCSSSKTHLAH